MDYDEYMSYLKDLYEEYQEAFEEWDYSYQDLVDDLWDELGGTLWMDIVTGAAFGSQSIINQQLTITMSQ